jgi:MFS family permease
LRTALPLYVYARTGSALSTGLTFLAGTVPALVLGPVAGALVDRWRPHITMIGADLGRAAVLLALMAGPGASHLWIVYMAVAGQACLSQFFGPARSRLIPAVASAEGLAAANAAVSAGSELALLVGPALGGAVYAAAGLRVAVGLDIASYLVSASTIGALRVSAEPDPRPLPGDRRSFCVGLLVDFANGLRLVGRTPILRALLAVSLVLFVGGGLLPVLIVPFADHQLHATAAQYGLVLSAQALGGLVGAAVVAPIMQRAGDPRLLIGTSLLAMAGAVAALGNTTRWWVAGLCLAAGGIPTTTSAVATATILQNVPAENERGRVAGLYAAATALGVTIGAPAAALLAPVGPRLGITITAAVFAGSGALAFLMIPAGPRRTHTSRR